MPDTVIAFGLVKIGINESRNTWGGKLNSNTDILATQILAAQGSAANAMTEALAKLPLTGGVLSGQLQAPTLLIDTNAYFTLSAGNPLLNFAPNDYLVYDRANNVLSVVINATAPLTMSQSQVTSTAPLSLAYTPTASSHAVPKSYVDSTFLPLSGGNLQGDLRLWRPAAVNTGAIFFGSSGSNFLFYDSNNFALNSAGGQIVTNGQTVWHTGNLTPSVYMPISGGTFTGNVLGNTGTVIQVGMGEGNEKRLALKNSVREAYLYLNLSAEMGIFDVTGGYTRIVMDAAGNFSARGNVGAFSDERLKADFEELPHVEATRIVQSLLPTYFTRTDLNDGKRHLGFIAQQVAGELPEAVSIMSDGMLAVSDRPIVAALVGAVQSLTERVRELELRLGR